MPSSLPTYCNSSAEIDPLPKVVGNRASSKSTELGAIPRYRESEMLSSREIYMPSSETATTDTRLNRLHDYDRASMPCRFEVYPRSIQVFRKYRTSPRQPALHSHDSTNFWSAILCVSGSRHISRRIPDPLRVKVLEFAATCMRPSLDYRKFRYVTHCLIGGPKIYSLSCIA